MFGTIALARKQCLRQLPSFVLGSSTGLTPAHAIRSSLGSTRSYKKATSPNYHKAPRNYEIKHEVVQVVNPQTKRLDPPQPIAEILESVKMNDYFVELVSSDPPVVKIVNRREANAAMKALKARRRLQPKNEMKEIQMSWGVNQADLGHKLKKAEDELARGNRVTLIFAPKAKRAYPKPQDMRMLLDEVMQAASSFAKECQPRLIERNAAAMYLQAIKKEKSVVEEE